MKKIFLTFASSNMKKALLRIEKQAYSLRFYDEIVVYNELNLSKKFLDHFKSKLSSNVRGYGYWVWKPQIILQCLHNMNEGDILQYTDAGCHLNPQGLKRLNDYFEAASQSSNGILAFQAYLPESSPIEHDGRNLPLLTEQQWIKGDLLDYFNVRYEKDITESPCIGSGIIFVRKCDEAVTIIKNWLTVYEADFSMADDSPSRSENLPGFIEHRHDQSIFSLLCKLNNVPTLSSFEYWYPKKTCISSTQDMLMNPDWNALQDFPIHAKRDRGERYFFLVQKNLRAKVLRIINKLRT